MEVSSQGLMMDRVGGIHYDVGVFTNLSPDHIGPGEHATFEEYRSWKGKLFQRCGLGVVNGDDPNTAALLEGHTCRLVTYGMQPGAGYRQGIASCCAPTIFWGCPSTSAARTGRPAGRPPDMAGQ